jgi:hypothetical protein
MERGWSCSSPCEGLGGEAFSHSDAKEGFPMAGDCEQHVSDEDKLYGALAVGSNGRKKRKGERGVEHQQPLKRGEGHGGWPCAEEMEGGRVRRGGHWSVIGVGGPVQCAVEGGAAMAGMGGAWRIQSCRTRRKQGRGHASIGGPLQPQRLARGSRRRGWPVACVG